MAVMIPSAKVLILVLLSVEGSKRGVAQNNMQTPQLQALLPSVSWTYNWKLVPGPQDRSSGMQFMPMVYNGQVINNGFSGPFNGLLGFNEPDIDSQAHMDPSHAAGIWPQVEQMANSFGVQTLVSPAMCGDIGKGTSWMSNFLNACQNCRVDAIAIHSYWCTLDGVKNLVDNYRRFGKKIWLTEFACADPNFDVSMAGQIRFMKEVVPYLEQEDIIEKYAWFSFFTNDWSYGITNPNPDAGLVYPSGDLSPLGQVYVSLGSGRRLSDNSTKEV
eukprot:CAMPEP_0114653844 /NCGR_PEP_ID=MMETSP0191-20121206/10064_1 /TAXON_ID=126664 /ORGANISM="Sorites sp." /LENGTH=272 /DNA_ID=CAMNT_0001869093 /DNA_START=1 /DNA_END=816 /DNA_ORIENTATION=+